MEGSGEIVILDEGDAPDKEGKEGGGEGGAGVATIREEGGGGENQRKEEGRAAWTFRLDAAMRQGYALSGDARNKTLHGVYVVPHQPGGGHRESLNIRFGLHARGHGSDDGGCSFSAFDEVDRHWGWTREETAEEAEAKKKSGKNKRKGGGYRGEEVVGKEAKKGK